MPVDVDEEGTWLSVYQRPIASPACDPDGARDRATVGHDEGYVGGANALEDTTYEFTYRWPEPDTYRLCAWIYRGGGATVAAAAIDVPVAPPPARLELAVRTAEPDAKGFEARARFTGTARGRHELRAVAVKGECPAQATDAFARKTVEGDFDVTLSGRLRFGTWRICGYLDGVSTARAEAELRGRLRPVALRRPMIGVIDPGRNVLQCFHGVWTAWPKRVAYRYEWRRRGRTVATGPRVRARETVTLRCRVTATNAAGSRTATSLPVTVG